MFPKSRPPSDRESRPVFGKDQSPEQNCGRALGFNLNGMCSEPARGSQLKCRAMKSAPTRSTAPEPVPLRPRTSPAWWHRRQPWRTYPRPRKGRVGYKNTFGTTNMSVSAWNRVASAHKTSSSLKTLDVIVDRYRELDVGVEPHQQHQGLARLPFSRFLKRHIGVEVRAGFRIVDRL